MNHRRDELHARQQFGRHNHELRHELERMHLHVPPGRGQDDWRSDSQRGQEDWDRGFSGVPTPRHFANEGLANDFSIEGTRNFARDERRTSHRGKGPKGYVRSDERIHELVSEALADHHDIDASDIEVTVKDREVTLTGTVDHRRTKRLVEHVIDAISGVEDIHNQLRVKPATP